MSRRAAIKWGNLPERFSGFRRRRLQAIEAENGDFAD